MWIKDILKAEKKKKYSFWRKICFFLFKDISNEKKILELKCNNMLFPANSKFIGHFFFFPFLGSLPNAGEHMHFIYCCIFVSTGA